MLAHPLHQFNTQRILAYRALLVGQVGKEAGPHPRSENHHLNGGEGAEADPYERLLSGYSGSEPDVPQPAAREQLTPFTIHGMNYRFEAGGVIRPPKKLPSVRAGPTDLLEIGIGALMGHGRIFFNPTDLSWRI
ncbi:hypothetical protein [Novosphingobium kaempferiae]|uniref:hypothetical protein n=1 Tax=Novosphingobium kaempferiae TaxID=2896849 RepID=UPI001E433766|nr:hypothetical protein [Novosphingobium kaempferiae]